MDADQTAAQARQIIQQVLGGLGAIQHSASLGQKRLADRIQNQPAPYAIEQFCVVPCFQRGDRCTDSGLGQMKGFSGARHMLALGDGDKDAELFERHARSIEFNDH